jgi:hypothetical protein
MLELEMPFREAIEHHLAVNLSHYGERLAAVYVYGSVYRCEALIGTSDLDLMIVTTDGFSPEDQDWELQRWKIQKQENSAPYAIETGPNRANSVARVMEMLNPHFGPNVTTCILYHDSQFIYGQDLRSGFSIPEMNRGWAIPCIEGPLSWARAAANSSSNISPAADGANAWLLPEPSRQIRKLARHCVMAGACLLMVRGRFQSFRSADVLAVLSELYPSWSDFYHEIGACPVSIPSNYPLDGEAYNRQALAWVEWVAEQVYSGS